MNGLLVEGRLKKCLDTTLLISEIRDLARSLDDYHLPSLGSHHEVQDFSAHRSGKILNNIDNFDGIDVEHYWDTNSTQICLNQMISWKLSALKMVENDASLYDDIFNNKIQHKKKSIKKKEVEVQKSFDPSNTNEVEEEIKRQRDKFYEDKGYVVKEKQSVKKFKKIWKTMIKKELGKCARQRASTRKEKMLMFKKAAKECSRICRQKAVASQKCSKDALTRGRRLAREISMCWRQLEKEEKTSKRKADRLLSEQKRKNLEVLEAKKQQRKLNYLITQTELYTHFMSRKMSSDNYTEMDAKTWSILERIEDDFDDKGDPNLDKEHALKSAKEAVDLQVIQVQNFIPIKETVNDVPTGETSSLFQGELKSYQKKGVDWLLYLFEQGINGILADEMGLGKTIQTIAFLATLAEKYDLWGPFLIVAPASTVHNWTQEFNKFLPSFRVVPYWGNVGERKILRRFWNDGSSQNVKPNLGDEGGILQSDSSFHVVVSSYQVVLQDAKMVGRVRWQYLVLDEAHAIKNTSSQRWNTLLSFECRNRLLLTGTPIQNTMQELWALLHFIMPTLFDSHEEFNDWFSRDIESQATAAVHASSTSLITTKLNTTQLSRLHLILQPFMLRRVKAEVEHELPDKIEISLQCHLSTRQRAMYNKLKRRIRIDDLSIDFRQQKSLLNLVMQLRKVCNHPDLVEPRIECFSVSTRFLESHLLWPRLLVSTPSLYQPSHTIQRLFSIYHPNNINHSLCNDNHSPFSFLIPFDINISDFGSYAYKGNFIDALTRRESQLTALAEGSYCKHTLYTNVSFHIIKSLDLILDTEDCLFLRKCLVLPVVAEPIRLGVSMPSNNLFEAPLSSVYLIHPITVHLMNSVTRIADSAKLAVLDRLLTQLKLSKHRVLIYSQMTRMIDIIEDLMYLRDHRFIRLDGSSRLSDRRDMVADFQSDHDIFAFLLSTRAGGLGINLTAADTVIFFDSDWNPTVDQQAMDRAHRLGQLRQVTVYRLVCRDTVEEKILFRAEEKREMHRMVIAGADLCPEQMKARDVASLLLEDEEMNVRLEQKRRQNQSGRCLSPVPQIGTQQSFEGFQAVTFTESALQKKRRMAWAGVMKSGTRPKKMKLQDPSLSATAVVPSPQHKKIHSTTLVAEGSEKSLF